MLQPLLILLARRSAKPSPAGARARKPSRVRRPRGFTLIELLVAISVMALLALLSWRGLDGMVRAQESTTERADDLLVLQAALGQWSSDLDALMPIASTTPIDWDGYVLRMTRRSTGLTDEGALVVAWTQRAEPGTSKAQWLRWQSPPVRTLGQWQAAWQQAAQWARSPGTAERQRESVLMPLQQWQLFYYRGGTWSHPLSSSEAAQSTSGAVQTNLIPDGIRLQLLIPPGHTLSGQLTRDWVNPLLGGGRS